MMAQLGSDLSCAASPTGRVLTDRRAQGLHLSPAGQKLQKSAQATATQLENDVTSRLSADEFDTLKSLLRKVYRP